MLRDTAKTMDEQLTQLLEEAKKHPPQSEERKKVLDELVKLILSSRKICRSYKGQPLWGIYKDIYESVTEQLLINIDEEIDNYNFQRHGARDWTNYMRDKAFKEVLNDTRLNMLATEVQRQAQTELRQHTLGELLEAILLSKKLSCPHKEKFNAKFYELLYDEAVNRTLFFLSRKIDDYDPKERGVMGWVNNKLSFEILDTRREFSWKDDRGKWIGKDNKNTPSLSELEKIAEEQATKGSLYANDDEELDLPEKLRKCIETDPENKFKKEHIRDKPEANFQAIALETFSKKTWEEISAKFGIKGKSTCTRFFQRCCQKFRHEFVEYIKNF